MNGIKVLFGLVFLFSSFSGCNKVNSTSQSHSFRLKGNVHTMALIELEPSIVQQDKYDTSGKVVYEFTPSGNVSNILIWRNSILQEKIKYNFGEEGRVWIIEKFDQNDKFISKVVMAYNSEGKLKSEEHYNSNNEMENCRKIIFNEQGYPLEEQLYFKKDRLLRVKRYFYDAEYRIIGEILYNGQGEKLEKKIYKYDNSNRIIEERFKDLQIGYHYQKKMNYTPGGQLQEVLLVSQSVQTRIEYTFDSDDNILTEYYFNDSGEMVRRVNHYYKLDHKGNWIKHIVKENDKIQKQYFREFNYYRFPFLSEMEYQLKKRILEIKN